MPRKKNEKIEAVNDTKDTEEGLKTLKEIEVPKVELELPAVPAVAEPVPLRTFHVDRKVESGYPGAKKLPTVRGGICEFCGVLDNKVAAHLQFTLCPHYEGVDLKCTYCPPESDWKHVLSKRKLQIFEFPEGSGNLVVVCDDISCRDKHKKRFQVGRN